MTKFDYISNMSDEVFADRLAEYTMAVQKLVRNHVIFPDQEWLRVRILENFRQEVEDV